MIKFIGEYSAKIDDKGRLVLPSAFKAVMSESEHADMRLVIKKNIYQRCLDMYTYEEWSRKSEELKSRLNPLNRDHERFWSEYMRNRALVEPDGKVGRISIPKKLLDAIGADKEVVFCGADHKIEIWAKEDFDAGGILEDEFISLAGSI